MRKKWTRFVRAFSVCTIAATLSACQEDLIEKQQVAHEVGFYAGGVQTRTTMLPNGLSAVWEPGDELAVWAKNSAGEFTLQNQTFKIFGIDGGWASFSTTLSDRMLEGNYTYMCCYPAPLSVDSTKVIFNLPSVQDGKVSGGSNIMIAQPKEYGPLTSIPEPDDLSALSLSLKPIMHQFRYYIPGDDQKIGYEKLQKILIDFPSEVTGRVTLDVSDPNASPLLEDASSSVELQLADPLGKSDSEISYACLALLPQKFEEGMLMHVKAYTEDKIAYFAPIDLKGKTCLSGHSTPVKLNILELVDYAGIIYVTIGTNNLGENPQIITLTAPEGCNWGDGGSNVYVYNPGREILVGETIAFKFETDVDAYTEFSGKEISITYESENALMSETLTMPEITGRGKTTVSMTVPYLLFEDFSCVYAEGESYGNNDYNTNDERVQPGSTLDACMHHKGWSAARYWTTGNAIRINSRYQLTGVNLGFVKYSWASTHYGRLDTPPLTCLKSGKNVSLNIEFSAGGYLYSNKVELSNKTVSVATHNASEAVLDGIPVGSNGISSSYDTTIDDMGTLCGSFTLDKNYGDNAFNSSYETYSVLATDMTSSSRVCFYPNLFPVSKDDAIATGNAEFYVYIDNIKISITK